jgi:hypothetical protein
MSEHREFDPARHPVNDVLEELSDALHRAAPDTDMQFPDRSVIKKVSNREYHIHNRAGQHISRHEDPEHAARHMLDHQAKSRHHFSVGGSKSHPSFGHYKHSHRSPVR